MKKVSRKICRTEGSKSGCNLHARKAVKRTVKDSRDSIDFGMHSRSLHLEHSSVLGEQARREGKPHHMHVCSYRAHRPWGPLW